MLENLFATNPETEQAIAPISPRKGVIIGAGQVGMAIAYSLLIQNCFDELVLQDLNKEKAEGEVMDLVHGIPLISPTKVTTGSVADAGKDADIVIVTAGASQKQGESRLDLVERNVSIFKGLIGDAVKHCPNAILLIVTNPVDIMTYVSLKISGWGRSRVLGSGTVLDTARFRALLAERTGIDPRSIHAYIVGEHGDSEVALYSKANVAGMKICHDGGLEESSPEIKQELGEIFDRVKNAAYEIIKRKGCTSYAIGLAVTDIVKAILRNQNRILTVSTQVNGLYGIDDICLSLPTLVNRQGVSKIINLSLSPGEEKQLRESSQVLRSVLEKLEL